jgi:flagellar biosynthetic protein FliR
MTYGAQELWSFLLVFARIAAMMLAAPILGNRSVPRQTRIGLSALLTFAVAPLVAAKTSALPPDLLTLVGRLAAETLVGLCLGFLVQLVFASVELAGAYLDAQMGFTMINTLNPMTGRNNSIVSQFLQQVVMTLWLVVGGHLVMTSVLVDSFVLVSPGSAVLSGSFSDAMTNAAGQMLVLAARIALPTAGVLALIDAALAIVSRTMPSMNVFFLGVPIKTIAGIGALALSLPMMSLAVGEMAPWLDTTMKAALKAVMPHG